MIEIDWKRDCLKLIPMNKTHHCHNIINKMNFYPLQCRYFHSVDLSFFNSKTRRFAQPSRREFCPPSPDSYDNQSVDFIDTEWVWFDENGRFRSDIDLKLEMSPLEMIAKHFLNLTKDSSFDWIRDFTLCQNCPVKCQHFISAMAFWSTFYSNIKTCKIR